MHAVLMFSARHLSILEPDEPEHGILELQHRQLALASLRNVLSEGVTSDNYDALMSANLLLAFHSCATIAKDAPDPACDNYLPLMLGVKLIAKAMWLERGNRLFGRLLVIPLTMETDKIDQQELRLIYTLDN